MNARRDIPYEQRRNANLPWGYWLTAQGEVYSTPPLADEEGRQWNSVREAFWISRLGMGPIARTDVMNSELELLLAVLVAIDRRVIGIEESAYDLFGGWDRARHYGAWLHGQGLVEFVPGCDFNTDLSAEGHAVLLMLASTRSPRDAPMPIGLASLKPYHGLNLGMDEEARERIMAEQERAAALLQYRFQREVVGSSMAIVLVGDALGPNVPLRRKLWSLTFVDTYARDRMYLWLHERIDRWKSWGELAYERGARELSEHLLQLRFADEPIELV